MSYRKSVSVCMSAGLCRACSYHEQNSWQLLSTTASPQCFLEWTSNAWMVHFIFQSYLEVWKFDVPLLDRSGAHSGLSGNRTGFTLICSLCDFTFYVKQQITNIRNYFRGIRWFGFWVIVSVYIKICLVFSCMSKFFIHTWIMTWWCFWTWRTSLALNQ